VILVVTGAATGVGWWWWRSGCKVWGGIERIVSATAAYLGCV